MRQVSQRGCFCLNRGPFPPRDTGLGSGSGLSPALDTKLLDLQKQSHPPPEIFQKGVWKTLPHPPKDDPHPPAASPSVFPPLDSSWSLLNREFERINFRETVTSSSNRCPAVG